MQSDEKGSYEQHHPQEEEGSHSPTDATPLMSDEKDIATVARTADADGIVDDQKPSASSDISRSSRESSASTNSSPAHPSKTSKRTNSEMEERDKAQKLRMAPSIPSEGPSTMYSPAGSISASWPSKNIKKSSSASIRSGSSSSVASKNSSSTVSPRSTSSSIAKRGKREARHATASGRNITHGNNIHKFDNIRRIKQGDNHRNNNPGAGGIQERESSRTPGAIRVGNATNDVEEARNDRSDVEEQGGGGEAEEEEEPKESISAMGDDLPLIAEAVPDEELEDLRRLQADNEALRKQVQAALENEQRALQQVQHVSFQEPRSNTTPDVAVVAVEAGDADDKEESEESNCYQCCRKGVTAFGCFCICCIVLVLIGAIVVTSLGLDAATFTGDDEPTPAPMELSNRRAALTILLRDVGPFYPPAFDWLTNVDTWEPPSSSIPSITNETTGGSKDRPTTINHYWMWVERYILAVLYTSTKGTKWVHNDGWLTSTSHCRENEEWFGISCQKDRVVSISLAANNLRGELPTRMDVLERLETIWIGDSNLTGTIPPLPTNLIMCWLCKYLVSLAKCNIMGNLYLTLLRFCVVRLFNLQIIHTIVNNELEGPFPTQLTELTNENQLTGEIPTSIINLSQLEVLELGTLAKGMFAKLTGTIPALPASVTTCNFRKSQQDDILGSPSKRWIAISKRKKERKTEIVPCSCGLLLDHYYCWTRKRSNNVKERAESRALLLLLLVLESLSCDSSTASSCSVGNTKIIEGDLGPDGIRCSGRDGAGVGGSGSLVYGVGLAVVGRGVMPRTSTVGKGVGRGVGIGVGRLVVGWGVGSSVGDVVGRFVGARTGAMEGESVGDGVLENTMSTCAGRYCCWIPLPSPSCPLELLPQHQSVSSTSVAHV
eukprot:scaffold2288_cov87-Cylindrotheca_fusiformis.AAC.3